MIREWKYDISNIVLMSKFKKIIDYLWQNILINIIRIFVIFFNMYFIDEK